jgi:cell division protein FtsA
MQEIYVGVDIGSYNTKVVVGEEKFGGEIILRGIGEAQSEGVARGNVVNIEKTEKSLLTALADAEKMADVDVKGCYLAVGGDKLRTISSRGVTAIPKEKETIDIAAISEVLQAARAIVIPSEAVIVDSVVREFVVDEQAGIADPVGMSGIRLEADVAILVNSKTTLENLERVAQKAGLVPDGRTASIRAAGIAVLAPDEAEIGVVAIDIGAGATQIGVFQHSTMVWASSLGYAGEAISKDLAMGLSLPFEAAESLKLEFGCALADSVSASEMVNIPGIGGREPRVVERTYIAEIIEARLTEIFEFCKKSLNDAGMERRLSAGIVLTGGTALTPEIVHLAEKIFGIPARIGSPSLPGDVPELSRSPQFSSCVGAILAASEKRHHADASEEGKNFWDKFRKWVIRKI